jgi:MFS transporter, FHS family, L-fucose permease
MNEYIYMKKNVIYLNDWLAIHPYTTVCSSDTFFVELANKLYAACHLEELPETFRKNLSLYVAAYLEDIISGLGLWQGFTTAHTRLYGRCLPFYPTGKDYIKGEVNLEDVRFIIWNTWQKAPYSHGYVNPLDTSILKQAQAFLPLLEEAYEVALENELLKDYFAGYADEKEADRKLSWLFGHTYLTEPSMLNTVVNPMLNTLGGGGKKGNQLIQTGGSLNSLSATIVPVLVGYLMGANVEERTIAKALPALYIAMAIFAIAFLVLFFMAIPEPSLSKANKSKGEHSPLSFRHFKLGTIAIFVYVGIEVGIPHFANLFMTAQAHEGGLGIDPAIAGSIVGTYWFLMLIGRLIGASLGAQFSSKAMLTVASILGLILIGIAFVTPLSSVVNMPVFKSGASLSFGLEAVPVSVMCMALCGLCTSIMWGGIFNLAVEGLGKYTEAASGIFMVMVCGGGLLPLLQGGVADSAGYLNSFIVIAAALAYLLFYALIGCKNVNKDIPTE